MITDNSKVKNREAPGSDNLQNELIEQQGEAPVIYLTQLLNKVLITRKIPDE